MREERNLPCLCTWLYLQPRLPTLWGSARLLSLKERMMRPGLQLMKRSEAHLSVALQTQTKSAHTINILNHFLSLNVAESEVDVCVCTLDCLSGLIAGAR